MNNYEGKLGEWLKYVQQQIDSSDKPEGNESPEIKQEARADETVKLKESTDRTERLVVRDRMGRITPDDVMQVEADEIIANSALLETPNSRIDNVPPIFDDEDMPDVEEFLPFLKDTQQDRRMPSTEPPIPPAPPAPSSNNLEKLSEGTGEPKPMVRRPDVPPIPNFPKIEEPKPIAPKAEAKAVEPKKPATPRRAEVKNQNAQPDVPSAADIQDLWGKMPKHIQILFGQASMEVAQNSYKQFKETREEMIEKLLDPILSLEESARILNVCPTTVRRYTNRGALRHFRTAGNQRRFRLSDVLAFLETSNRTEAVAASSSSSEDGK